ncbi:MAG: DUF1080 domain-containing protein [Planctomycetaceae bacterium]|jgi:hypothetical protein|nr:DUF1080 domain-containing protein [Planctomycetaceae bacterium]
MRKIIILLFVLFFAPNVALNADDVLQQILALPPESRQKIAVEHCAVFGGGWKFDGGTVSIDAGAGPKLVCTKPGFTDMTDGEISVEMFFPKLPKEQQTNAYRNAGILLNVKEPGDGADAFIGYEIAPSAESQHINIGRHQHNYTPLKQVPFKIPAEKWFTLQVKFNEAAFEVFIDGESAAKYSGGKINGGSVALRPWQRLVKYRNWKITANGNTFTVPLKQAACPADVMPPSLATEGLPPLLFITRAPLSQPNSVGNDIWQGKPTAPGCSIRLINPAKPELPVQTLFEDKTGSIYDGNLSADAETVYFSYRRAGELYWHLWRLNINDKSVRQLTDGPFHDVSPCEAPDGSLIFVSTRRFGYTLCQPGPSSNLHRLKEQKISCVSMNTLSDFSPAMLPDGRVLFTRWEYIDRDLTYRQSLWTQNPDGTGYQLFFGNTIRDVGTFWQARPLPGQNNICVATFAPHHGYPHGMIGLIDRRAGVEGEKGKGFIYITKEVPAVGDRNQPWGYRDPFPLNEETFLCSYGSGTGFYKDGKKRFALYLLNRQGQKRLLYEDKEQSCFFPMPLVKAQPVADKVPAVSAAGTAGICQTGTVLLTNVNEGLQGKVKPGVIVALRIMEQVRKTEDLVRRAYDQSPVMSYGTYYAKRDWGTVPLEKDGSAHFIVPALREIYLQGLDSEGREVFRMTSALQVMPGERVSCFGCHENRDAAPVPVKRAPLAAAKEPVKPQHPEWLMNRERINPQPDAAVFDYPSVVQPVWDKYCVSCHNGEKADGGYDLTGDKTRFFSMSYDNLLGTSKSYRQHDLTTGKMLPEEAAKGKPLVHFFWLLFTPTAVNEPYITGSYASRLTELIESSHGGVSMPPVDRQKIYYWIDANVPYYGTYAHSRPNAAGRRDRFADPKSGDDSPWFGQFLEVYRRRCAECHSHFEQPDNRDWIGRYAWINLSKPERSAALTAHLSDSQGIRSKTDEDYVKMRNAIEEGKRIMEENPEADMPDFRNARPEP